MNRAAFLDRDGVINRKAPEGAYITRWEEMQLLPKVGDAIGLLNQAGFRVIVVSNQRCVAKGLITIAELEALHTKMREELLRAGATIDALYYCPHETEPPCRCRKPKPGLLLDAALEHDIDLATSWMIGDSTSDVEAGRNAGCKTVYLNGGSRSSSVEADLVAPALLEAVRQVLEHEESGGRRGETGEGNSGKGNLRI